MCVFIYACPKKKDEMKRKTMILTTESKWIKNRMKIVKCAKYILIPVHNLKQNEEKRNKLAFFT